MTTETATTETAPVKKHPAKKAAKKAVKNAKKKAAKTASKNGLAGNEIKILKALSGTASNGKMLDRSQLATKTGIARGWSKTLGSSTKTPKATSLEGRGLIGSAKLEGERLSYYITAPGRKALEAAK